MLWFSLLSSLVVAGPEGVLGAGDTVVLPSARHAHALPEAALIAGRVGGLPALRIEVFSDRVLVDGNAAVVLTDGDLVDDGEFFVRPVFEKLSETLAKRLSRGATTPFVAVIAVDGRVMSGALERILYTAQMVGIEEIAVLVQDKQVAEPWAATQAVTEAAEPGQLTGLSLSAEGFVLEGVIANDRALRGLSLDCESCTTVSALPWADLDQALSRLAKAKKVGPSLELNVAESNIAASAMMLGLDALRALDRPVTLSELALKPLGPGMVATAEPVPVPWGSRLEVISARLPAPNTATVVQPIPLADVERVFFAKRGRTDACLALSAKASGRAAIRLQIAKTGKVEAATVAEISFEKKAIGQCLVRVIREMEFPTHNSEESMVVVRSFVVSAD